MSNDLHIDGDFTINIPHIDGEFVNNEQPDIQADFSIKLTPEKVSQLENDLNYQTQEQVQEAIQAESDVINARIDDEVNTLNSAIESEAATRAETDTSLQNDINTLNDNLTIEISNRTSADEVLQGNIDTVSGNLTTEISDRQDADATLQGNINTVANDLSIEETARINADTTLQGNIDTLSGTVTSNYNTLSGAISDETSARQSADTTLQNNITAEATARGNADDVLDGKIGDNKTSIDNHIADKTNPHEVTKSQVGLGNVDNTSDLDKPISTATQTALDGKQNTINDLSEIRTNASNGQSAYNTIQNYGDIVTYNASFFATSIQGEKADTALQPNDDISELNNDVGYITSASLPTVNNSTITFQKNNITVGDINLNQGNNETINFDIPTTASDVNALPDTTTINDLTTTAQQNALNSGANTSNIGQIATNTQNISNEVTNRQNADNNLQSQIDALVVASDVFDIVGTYAELQAYDISTVPVNDIIKVLVDSTHNNAATYYRCVENDNVKSWSYIGAEGAYYTKSEADGRFVEQTTTVNGQALSNNITLDAEDVGALPDTTTIGNGTLTIQKNGSTIDSFGANDTGNTIVNITVPTATSDLTNDSGFITGIDSSDVTTALGYTPYNSSNPSGYQANVIETVKVNNTALTPDSSKAVNISVPTDTSDLTNNAGYIKGINSTDVTNALGYTPYDSSNPNGYTTNTGTVTSVNNVSPVNGNVTLSIPAAQVNSDWNATSGKAQILNKPSLATVATSGSYNDLSNKPTIPAAVTVDSALSSTSTNPVQNKVITGALPDTSQLSYYGTCSTAAATQTKVVVCEGFTLKTGVSIRIKFTNGQTYNGMPSLNVNSTGAINVKSNGTVNAARYCWMAGEVVSFTYDGTNWIMEDAGIATTTYYGYTKLYTGAGSTSTSTALTPASLNNLVQLMVEPYPIYSTSSTYEVGDRVRYGYQAWECITAITTAETWNADHWKEIDPIQTQLDNKVDKTSIVSTVSASSTNEQVVGAKLFYDTVGNIETALNTINSGSNS